MEKKSLEHFAVQWLERSPLNRADTTRGGEHIHFYDAPLFGYADASDELFAALQAPGAIGPHFRLPGDWLPGARTVISFFLPFSEEVRRSNRLDAVLPSEPWAYGRIEGQQCIDALCRALTELFTDAGCRAVSPSLSPDFQAIYEPADDAGRRFTSNWSERHVAFVCGLGTFGLSKGIITEKGMAGRLGSIITDWQTASSPRPYTELYEYCILCGECVRRCPAGAITLEKGKDHHICRQYMAKVKPAVAPRYGCGKCQTDVPCEFCRP